VLRALRERPRLAQVGAGARRFAAVLGGVAATTAAVSALLGLLFGSSLDRAISVGFYLVGCLLLVGGFFLGNRGPVRPKGEAGPSLLGPRFMRWATPDEHDETINSSAVFVTIGFVLLLLGVFVDSRVKLV
jgi:hypothetical protein